MLQYHCDVCKKSWNLFIVKVPELIYFCLECCDKSLENSKKNDPYKSNSRYILYYNDLECVKEFKELYL